MAPLGPQVAWLAKGSMLKVSKDTKKPEYIFLVELSLMDKSTLNVFPFKEQLYGNESLLYLTLDDGKYEIHFLELHILTQAG